MQKTLCYADAFITWFHTLFQFKILFHCFFCFMSCWMMSGHGREKHAIRVVSPNWPWDETKNGWKVLELSNHLYIYDSMLISTGYCCPCKDEVVKVKRVCATPWVWTQKKPSKHHVPWQCWKLYVFILAGNILVFSFTLRNRLQKYSISATPPNFRLSFLNFRCSYNFAYIKQRLYGQQRKL